MVREGMGVEVKSRNKKLYKTELYLIKVIPMIMALICLVNTVLSYFYIDLEFLGYLGGSSLLIVAFLYLSSYVFGFCTYHRMFIHYIMVNTVLNTYDYYVGIPLTNKGIFLVYMSITGVTLFTILYLKFRK